MTNPLPAIMAFIRKHVRVGIDRQNDLFGKLTITFIGIGPIEISLCLYRAITPATAK